MLLSCFLSLLFSFQDQTDPSKSGVWFATTSDSVGLPIRIELLTSTLRSGKSFGSVRFADRASIQKEVQVEFLADSVHVLIPELQLAFHGVSYEDSLVGTLDLQGRSRKIALLRQLEIQRTHDDAALKPIQVLHHVSDRSNNSGLDSWLVTKVNTTTPLIVVIPEFGADIDGTGPSGTMYATMALQFVREGYRVLRIAPPSAQPSKGRSATTYAEYATLIAASIRKVNGLQANVIALCHGDGSRVVLQKALHDAVAAIVSIGGTVSSSRDAFLYSIRKSDSVLAVPEVQTAMSVQRMGELYDIVRDNATNASLEQLVRTEIERQMQTYEGKPTRYGVFQRYQRPNASIYISKVLIPWLKWKTSIESVPSIDLVSVTRPTLWCIPTNDVVVPPNASYVQSIHRENKKIELMVLDNTSHYMQECTRCTSDEAEGIEATVRKDTMRAIAIWLANNNLGTGM